MIALLVRLAFAGGDRQQDADAQFDQIMQSNAVLGAAAKAPAPAEVVTAEPAVVATATSPLVEVPLDRYEAVRARIATADARAARSYETLVVLGASTWSGEEVEGGLRLHLTLQATLSGPGFWKSVPLVGEEVAVVSASAGGTSIALTNQSGYQVWVTDAVGEVTLDLDVLVPARGPRGSLEYDFLVARTPVTRFDCSFPESGLDPRLERTVRADVTGGQGTHLSAWLEPTSRIHLVGYKDLGETDGQPAKLYVETTSLVSVEESEAELFTVLRYAILQAGARQFDILVPTGLAVVSADGAGAFRYSTEVTPQGTLLHGDTAFPIRDRYEVSLRLSRPLADGALDLRLPHAVGAERETGWLGLEVLGPVQVEEIGKEAAVAVDVAQLPAELVGNAVSPVLEGWRYHAADPIVHLSATRLPEREPAAGSVDRVDAVTTLSPEGRARTDVRITLRNRLRHSLSMRLPPGMEVRLFELDGAPASPSTADGTLILPLKRSAGERPTPFSLHLVLEGDAGALWPLGLRSLALPALELPVSDLRWEVDVPAQNRYTRLFGDIAAQAGTPRDQVVGDTAALHYTRFWVGADQAVSVRFGWIRGWLVAPLALLGAVGLALGGARLVRTRLGVVGALAALGALGWIGAGWAALALGGAGAAWIARGGVSTLRAAWDRWRAPTEAVAPGSWRAMALGSRLLLASGTGIVALVLLLAMARVVVVLGNPWG